jgi:hypothetical protein
MHGRGVTPGQWLLLLIGMGCCSSCAPDPTVLPPAQWGGAYAAAECARIFGCCDATEQMRWSYTDEAQCRQTAATDAQAALDDLLSVGWATYDGKAARRCVDDIATMACADLLVIGKTILGPSCGNITRGTGKIGAACEDLDVICESSNCEPGPGTCGPTRGCNVICAASEYCDTTAQTCAPFKTDGTACASSAECVFPLSCQSSGLCATPRPGGASCQSTSDCASASCTGGTCDVKLCDGV